MKIQPPVKKNDELTLTIDSLSLEGQGIGRHAGYILFVPGALPGETCRVHVIKVTSGYGVAKLLSVETPSPDRVEPLCPAAATCGGCALQHLSYPAQLRYKEQSVVDALTRLGGFTDLPMRPILGMEEPWRYRNKGSFPFGTQDGAVVYGFFAQRSHRLIPVTDCPIQNERAMEILGRIAEWANTYGITAYDESTGKGQLRHAMVRTASDGSMMAVVVTSSQRLRQREALIELLSDVDSLYHNVNPHQTNVIFGDEFHLLSGSPVIQEELCGLSFQVSPQSFLQVNHAQTEKLYEAAVSLLAPTLQETVADAYCGIGTISLLLARQAGRVLGIEYVAPAVENARDNARRNGLTNASFFCGDAAELLKKLAKEEPIHALVTDPPRKGMDEPMVDAILSSKIPRIVYVSCNPATLARDCKALAAGGYVLKAVQPVDMFPHAGHVETVVLMTKKYINRNFEETKI